MSSDRFGNINIEPKRASVTGDAFWATAGRAGFTDLCRAKFGEFLEGDTEGGVKFLQQRGDMLATVIGLQQAKACVEIRRATVLS